MTDTPDTTPAEASFEGHENRTCREHRTVGPHRAWCFDDSEWCYPDEPCRGCEVPAEVRIAQAVAAEREAIATQIRKRIADLMQPFAAEVYLVPELEYWADLLAAAPEDTP